MDALAHQPEELAAAAAGAGVEPVVSVFGSMVVSVTNF